MPTTNSNSNGKRLSESQRVEIIRKLQKDDPPAKRALGREYNVSEGAIRSVWLQRETILSRTALMSDEAMKGKYRTTNCQHPELEDKLYLWIDTMRRKKLEVPPSLALHKAKRIAILLGISEENFKGMWQWLKKFRIREGLDTMMLAGEGAEVDKEDPILLEKLDALYTTIATYDNNNVYNMDETGLFYRLLPRYTLLMPQEDVNTTRGKKKSKDRVTVIVCANATGTHKIPCTLIGKAKSPACVHGREWPLPYLSQNKVWMDTAVCWKWFNEVFAPAVKRRTGQPVLLILDNAPGHFDAFERDGIRVIFFPPNCTSWKQPCDMGIIAALKKRYKYKYLSEVLTFHDMDEEIKTTKTQQGNNMRRGAAGIEFGRPATILDAANWLKECWESITVSTIHNCFRKAEKMPSRDNNNDDVELVEIEDNDFLTLINQLQDVHLDKNDINEYLHNDDEDADMFVEEILNDVDDVLASVDDPTIAANNLNSKENDGEESEGDVEEIIEKNINFDGFRSLYLQFIKLKEQIIIEEFNAIDANNTYDKAMSQFEKLEATLRDLNRKEESARARKSTRQLTIHDTLPLHASDT